MLCCRRGGGFWTKEVGRGEGVVCVCIGEAYVCVCVGMCIFVNKMASVITLHTERLLIRTPTYHRYT